MVNVETQKINYLTLEQLEHWDERLFSSELAYYSAYEASKHFTKTKNPIMIEHSKGRIKNAEQAIKVAQELLGIIKAEPQIPSK